MAELATMLVILTEHGTTARINASDFDPRFHREVGELKPAPEFVPEPVQRHEEPDPIFEVPQTPYELAIEAKTLAAQVEPLKPRGRPKGSRNKSKELL
jgi:hypothetical protein